MGERDSGFVIRDTKDRFDYAIVKTAIYKTAARFTSLPID